MATQTRRVSNNGRGGGGLGAFAAGFLLAAALAAGAWFFLHPRRSSPASVSAVAPPAAGTRRPLPSPPFGTSEDVFEAGAKTYAAQCASCHGTPRRNGSLGKVDQFWQDRSLAILDPGAIFLATRNGASPIAGVAPMHAYARVLTDTQIWQVALLLKNSGQPLPDPVVKLLEAPAKSR